MTLEEAWKIHLQELESSVNKQSFDTWISPLTLLTHRGHQVVFSVPNRFFIEWLDEHYTESIQKSLRQLTADERLEITFAVQGASPLAAPSVRERRSKDRQLQPKYNFKTFVVGAGNQFAHAASQKVAEQPGEIYNPFFIYGGVGLGKTHLLNAIGNAIRDRWAGVRIAYVSSEVFTNELINSIRHDKTGDFRTRYRTIDVLLIDDIQFIAGKERTQEEFFHTFNSLYEDNKQIVISCDRSTKELADIELRLRSRFEMGLTADIQPPDLETRIAILKRKAEEEHFPLEDDIALFVATHVRTNIRELEGALRRVIAYKALTGRPMTVDFVKEILHDLIGAGPAVVTIEHIMKTVADKFQVKISDLKSKRRTKILVQPRQLAMYLCRTLTDGSYPEIGRQFGGKDHSTVIHAVRQISDHIQRDPQLKAAVDTLTKTIRA